MKTKRLKDILKEFKSGWVAIRKKDNSVVATAETFSGISERVKKIKGVYLFPASDNYFGFITVIK